MEEVKNEIVEVNQAENEKLVATGTKSATLDYMDGTALNKVYKNAQILASSDLVPMNYKNKPQNIMLAMDMASRMGMGLMTVMQSLYVVNGTPSWSGSFCVAAINNCGKFTPLTFVTTDEGGGGVIAKATRISDGTTCSSIPVTMQMAKDEGWLNKNGSKWKTDLRFQMMRYRAASYFARTYCPEVLMGLQTADEIRDVNGYEEPKKSKTTITLDTDFVEVEK